MLDAESSPVCNRIAGVLRKVGDQQAEALAWEYLTTPIGMHPGESAPFLSLAGEFVRFGETNLADECYTAAFQAEPTNAQILWDHARFRVRIGQTARAQELFGKIAKGDWQPRFQWLVQQAKEELSGR